MTNATQRNDQGPDGPYAAVEAFMDGELVLPEALRDALADQAVRDHLVDLLILREAVGAMVAQPCSTGRRGPRVSRLRLLATAAAVLVSLTVGYLAGQRVEAPVAAQSVEAVVHVQSAAPSAPKPTQIITLRPGINWTETSGGQ